ncbi:MAG: hypothetical protein IPP83_05670 [Flavobacteriales bacterium]|nr:hypothetical protein [Flavobacteriales bacterium]
MHFGEEVTAFLRAANDHSVRMVLIGGGAVNFHGYQRQSPDLEFWMEPTSENFNQLAAALRSIGYDVDQFPDPVLKSDKNITLKMSPGLEVEVITFLRPGCTFEEAWSRAELIELSGEPVQSVHVMSLPDLLESKARSGRPKDLLDILELKRKKGSA